MQVEMENGNLLSKQASEVKAGFLIQKQECLLLLGYTVIKLCACAAMHVAAQATYLSSTAN
jgi:hypothetical protein